MVDFQSGLALVLAAGVGSFGLAVDALAVDALADGAPGLVSSAA
jgi:hypothetical protein